MRICLLTRSNRGNDINNFFYVKALKNASLKRGHTFDIIDPGDLIYYIQEDNLLIKTGSNKNILDFDVYIPKVVLIKEGVKRISDRGILVKYLIDHNKIFFNFTESFRSSSRSKMYDFFRLASNNVPLIPSIYIEDNKDLESVDKYIKKFNFSYPLILKSNKGLQGKNLFYTTTRKEVHNVLQKYRDISFIIQPYYEIMHDLRIIVLKGKILGTMDKIHKKDDFRGNIAQGAIGVPYDLDKAVQNIALNAAQVDGSEFVGVDIAITNKGPFVLEVNRNLGFQGFSKFLKVDTAGIIVEYLESLYNHAL